MLGNNHLLWEDHKFIVCTPFNPHIPLSEGHHIVIKTKHDLPNAWADPVVTAQAFQLASQVCRVMKDLKMAPWFNLQANGNWGLLPEGNIYFHVHIYSRLETSETWAKPVELPKAPKTYNNDPMSEQDRVLLSAELEEQL